MEPEVLEMKTMLPILLLVPVFAAATCAAGRDDSAPPPDRPADDRAMSMRIQEPAFRKAEVLINYQMS